MSLPRDTARTLLAGFDKHYRLFREISAGAKTRFESAHWEAAREASMVRIEMYDQRVREAVRLIKQSFPEVARDESLWPQIKRSYIAELYSHRQPECAETFYNSVACRVLDRRYYNNDHIFWRPAVSTEYFEGEQPTYHCYYPGDGGLREVLAAVLERYRLETPFHDLERDLDRLVRAIDEKFPKPWHRHFNFQLQVLSSLFYRNKAAYVVGRVLNGSALIPLVIPLMQDERGMLHVDTLLLDRRNVGRVFSLMRAYFMVDMEAPSAYVEFLRSLLPTKPAAELYTMLGLQKQGKTLAYRDLIQHLKHSSDRFVLAPGTKGMVMVVFTLPSFPFVFKVIRDSFEAPKTADRAYVENRYQLVKLHDRVGRLADTLEYSHVAFPRERFSKELLDELERLAPSSLERDGDRVVIRHLYFERRLIPLDVYLRTATEEELRRVMLEYGNAIKDLIGANIFPGDLLIKNFGLTRYGRVVFYDYDELCYLTECNFRHLPSASNNDDEMSAEPWFYVGPNDVFPEQFPTFLVPEGRARELFMEYHADLADPEFWVTRQQRVIAGVQEDLFPYQESMRFVNRYP